MLQLRIALRYLLSKKTHNAVNVISLISVAGVAIATAALVVVLSVFNGFEKLALSQLSAIAPPVKVVPAAGKVIADADSLARAIASAIPGATALPTIDEQGLAIVGNRQKAVAIKGVDSRWLNAASLAATIVDGEPARPDSVWPQADISVGVAIGLKAHPGAYELLGLYVPRRRGRVNPANPYSAFRGDSLVVAGVFQTGDNAADEALVIAPLNRVRTMLDYTTEATAIEVWPPASTSAIDAAKTITALGRGCVKALTLIDQDPNSLAMISVEKWVTFMMLAFILLIASFNIVSTLSLLVIEKRDNINALRAMGATTKMISRIFSIEGWLISLTGGAAGLVIGTALTLAQQWGGFVKLSGDKAMMTITVYPVELRPADLLTVAALVAATGLATAAVSTVIARRGASRNTDNR